MSRKKGNSDAQLIGQVTQEQINEWKAQHKAGIYSVTSDAGHVAYFKNPTRHEVNCALSEIDKDNPIGHLHVFAGLCFIGGSEAVLGDDEMSMGVEVALKEKLNGISATLVNL